MKNRSFSINISLYFGNEKFEDFAISYNSRLVGTRTRSTEWFQNFNTHYPVKLYRAKILLKSSSQQHFSTKRPFSSLEMLQKIIV